MDSYVEEAHQEEIRTRLEFRNTEFVSFEAAEDDTIIEVFDRRVYDHPHKTAIATDCQILSYAGLYRASSNIGSTLRREMDEAHRPIVVLVGHATTFVASMLGVLRAGGFYIPLDPSFPEQRNARILEESGAKIILSDKMNLDLAGRLARDGQQVLSVDDVRPSQEVLKNRSRPDDLAYTVFTSGSTGRPKGVMQTHRNLLQVVKRCTNNMYLGSEDRYALLASCSVTAAASAILSALLSGITLLQFSVLSGGLHGLADWINAQQVTVYHSVPSLFRHLMKSVGPEALFPSVQLVRLSGDSVSKSDWELFKEHFSPDSILVQFYGCSEISSVCRFYADSTSRLADGIVPAGYSLAGVDVSLLGSDGAERAIDTPAALGSVGEIVLRSRYLSPGYWRKEFADGTLHLMGVTNTVREYRTGDLGIVRSVQGLVHVGRMDLQVKMAGFRVEIAEIEACVRGCPGVRESAIIVRNAAHGERELIGFAELQADSTLNDEELLRYVRERMPSHMVPSAMVVLHEMPSTPNGKVDRAALLPLFDELRRYQNGGAPGSATEEALRDIWRTLLRQDSISVQDNFFALGGNSLLGLRLALEATERLSVPISGVSVFRYPTIREMAQWVEKRKGEHLEPSSDGPAEVREI